MLQPDRKISPMKFFSSSVSPKLLWTTAYSCLCWHIDWSHESYSMKGQTTFSKEVHIVSSISSGFSRKTACAFLSWSTLENVCVCICCFCHFTFILAFLAFCFCFFPSDGSTSSSSPSEVILSISSFLILKTSTSPAISSGNPCCI